MTIRIDGKAYAEKLRAQMAQQVQAFEKAHGVVPGLAVVLVGDDPASEVYVRNKGRQTRAVGMRSFEHRLAADTTQETLLAQVQALNTDPGVHGILVQLPLPAHLDAEAIIASIAPQKDVDGFHIYNAGRLFTGQPGLVPCTPLGCMMLLEDTLGDLSGKHAVVIGRSNIVGKPMAALLLQANCTVTVVHSRTADLPAVVRGGDIVVAAVGKPQWVQRDWVKPGATIIDVGINRVTGSDGKARLVGDVAFDQMQGHAHAITPVPGGVGPMTIACLLHNTLRAAHAQLAVPSV